MTAFFFGSGFYRGHKRGLRGVEQLLGLLDKTTAGNRERVFVSSAEGGVLFELVLEKGGFGEDFELEGFQL